MKTYMFLFIMFISILFTKPKSVEIETNIEDNSDDIYPLEPEKKISDVYEENNVLVLDESNLEQSIKKYGILLIDFYAPWCVHCKELAPHFEAAAKVLRSEPFPVLLAKVDIQKDKNLAKKYEIEYLPTIKLYVKGEAEVYQGGRTENEIVSWIRKKTGPPAKLLRNPLEVDNFFKEHGLVFVFFGDNEKLKAPFDELARAYEELEFGWCSSEECIQHYGIQNGSIIAFKTFDGGNQELTPSTTDLDITDIKNFVDINTVPIISDFNDRTGELVFSKQMPGLFFFKCKDNDINQEMEEAAKKIALNNIIRGHIQIVFLNLESELEKKLGEYVKVTENDLPTIRIFDTRQDLLKFIYNGDIGDNEGILNFVKNWIDGKLEINIKSEEIPEKQENAVMTIVAKNYNEIVYDETKDVLVEYVVPRCTECKEFEPYYEELALSLKKDNPNLILVKIDVSVNEIDNIDLKSYPTIKLFRKRKKDRPINFDDERDINSLLLFLEINMKGFIRPLSEEGEDVETLEEAIEKAKPREYVINAAKEEAKKRPIKIDL